MSILPLYATAVAVLIVMLSGSPYEFMIGEIRDGKPLTICDLPPSIDAARDVYLPATCVLVLVLLSAGIVRSIRSRRITTALVLGCILFMIWLYRFFLRTLGC